MPFTSDEIRANRDYFAHKLSAEKARASVLHAVEDGKFDFILLDTRGREPFASGHIPGSLCAPIAGSIHRFLQERERATADARAAMAKTN